MRTVPGRYRCGFINDDPIGNDFDALLVANFVDDTLFGIFILIFSGLDVRLQFDLDLEHKLDYCKVFDSNPETTTPKVNRYLLRSVIVFICTHSI